MLANVASSSASLLTAMIRNFLFRDAAAAWTSRSPKIRIKQERNSRRGRHKLGKQLKPLSFQSRTEKAHSCRISARPVMAFHKTFHDRFAGSCKYNWD